MNDYIVKETRFVSYLFSVFGPFDVTNQLSTDSEIIRRAISDSISFALKKHKINPEDMFLAGNLSAFRFNENALSFAAKRDKVDIYLQKTTTGTEEDIQNFNSLVCDFIFKFAELSNVNFYRFLLNKTISFNFSKNDNDLAEIIFPFNGNRYVGITTIDENDENKFNNEMLKIVSTFSYGYIKEMGNPRISLQLEVTTDQLNRVNRLGKQSIDIFLKKAVDCIENKQKYYVDYIEKHGRNR